MNNKDKRIAELEAERDQLRELCRDLRDSLTSAKGWVVTYAMQTHSRMASSEAEKINVLLEKADAILGDEE